MHIRKIKILLIIIGLLVLPFLEISQFTHVSAEEFDPPTLTAGHEESTTVLDEGKILEPPPPAENSQDTVDSEPEILAGQDPESILPPGSIQILLPASQTEPGEIGT